MRSPKIDTNSLILLNLSFSLPFKRLIGSQLPLFCQRFNQVGTQYKIHEIYIKSPQKHR